MRKYPSFPSQRIARFIFEKYPELGTQEEIRSVVRYYRGQVGVRRDKVATDEFFEQPYDLPLPSTYDSSEFIVKENSGLLLADLHAPFHDILAIKTAFDWAVAHKKTHPIEFVLLDGDVMDNYHLSAYIKNPKERRIKEEIDDVKDILRTISDTFKAKIYYKFSNHERRYDNYIYTHAEQFADIETYNLENVLSLKNYNCEVIKNKRVIKFGHLNIVHGDEFRTGIIDPVNPARTLFLRAKEPTIGAHFHRTSEHNGRTIGRKLITCWSVGCLCNLSPEYCPINEWNHGFAFLTRDKDYYKVINLRIENGMVY